MGLSYKGVQAIKDYIFNDDLHNTPLSLTTVKHGKSWITILENVPVLTFRGNSYKQDVIGVSKTAPEALKFHRARLAETIKVNKEAHKKNG
jgi:sRNA-binding carbon storage regulator CsrA